MSDANEGNFENWLQTASGKVRQFGHWDFRDFDGDTYGSAVGLLCQIIKIAQRSPRRLRHPKGGPQYDYAYPMKETETSAIWMIDDLVITVSLGSRTSRSLLHA